MTKKDEKEMTTIAFIRQTVLNSNINVIAIDEGRQKEKEFFILNNASAGLPFSSLLTTAIQHYNGICVNNAFNYLPLQEGDEFLFIGFYTKKSIYGKEDWEELINNLLKLPEMKGLDIERVGFNRYRLVKAA